MLPSLTLFALDGVPEVGPGDDLCAITLAALDRSGETAMPGDIFIYAQKIVSKAERRLRCLTDVVPSDEARDLGSRCDKDPRVVELILGESCQVLRVRPGVIVVETRQGVVAANAGIDASNVDNGDHVLLLPADPDASARRLCHALQDALAVPLAVVINDSIGRAWRQGTVGTALGAAGLPALIDLRGRPDRNGRRLESAILGAADEVASAASLVMGQADEGRPIVVMRGFPYGLDSAAAAADILRPREMDMFR